MTRYRAASDTLRIAASPQGGAIAYAPWSRSAHMLDDEDWHILRQAAAPATLEAHASRIAKSVRMTPEAVMERLTELRDDGLLIDSALLFEPKPTSARPAPITRIGIPTRNRPAKLRACIESWADMARRHERSLEVIVADDGRTDDERAPIRAEIERLAQGGVQIAYAGPEQRLRYAAELSEASGVDPELVRWLLHYAPSDRTGEGTVRNALLLHGIGAPLVMVDDDTLCHFAPPPRQREGLTIGSQNPLHAWFPNPGESATKLVKFDDTDPLAMMETALGRDVADWSRSTTTTFDRAPSLLCRRLREHGGRIAALQVGIAGDVATGSVAHYLTLSGPARQHLHRSERVYEHAIASRQGVVSAERWTMADIDHCMTYLLALDLRFPTPPFIPMGRNTDGLFGTVMHLGVPHGYVAFAPWVMKHDATPRPSSRQTMIDTAPNIYGNDILLRILRSADLAPPSDDPNVMLPAVGRALAHAAACESDEFAELLYLHMARTRTHDLSMLERALKFFKGEPTHWAVDVRKTAEHVRHLLTQPALAHPHDLTRAHGARRAVELLQHAAQCYAKVLVAWPRIWEAAQQLAARGIRVAEPITRSAVTC